MGEKLLLVLSANLVFHRKIKAVPMAWWISILRVHTRLFHFLTMCDERCVPNTSPAPTAALATFSLLEAPIPGDKSSLG